MSKGADTRTGLVVAAHGRHFIVELPDGQRMICHPRGKKSDCVVGDRVQWQPAGDEGVIERIDARRNLLFRQDEWRVKSFAANLDQLMVMVAGEPMFSETQLTRALIAAESAGIAASIVLNKTDLPAADLARERLKPYVAMGIEVMELSLKMRREEALAVLTPKLKGRTTLVLGPSGTGKSTMINHMVPNAAAEVGEISLALNSGKHTTTSTRWYWIDDERTTALIDSPGFQEFGMRHIEAQQLALLMPDLARHVGECRFYNCTHRQEPGCGVRAAVESGEISPARYRIYNEIHDELMRTKW